MKLTAKVHTLAPTTRPATVSIDGKVTEVSVPCVAVELVTDDGHQSNPTIYLSPEEAESLKPGTPVTITYAWTKEPAA